MIYLIIIINLILVFVSDLLVVVKIMSLLSQLRNNINNFGQLIRIIHLNTC